MSGYNGKATIDFVIERIKDLETDQYRLFNNKEDDADRVEELELSISGTSYYMPGRSNCEVEDSFPDEGETEITDILWHGKKFPWDLTSSEEERAKGYLCEEVQEDDGDYDDAIYDGD